MPSQNEISIFERMVASTTGAVLTSIFVTPFDVIRVRRQTERKSLVCPMPSLRLSPCLAIPMGHRKSGNIGMVTHIVRNEGLPFLWTGFSATLVLTIPSNVLYFSCYDQIKQSLGYENTGHHWAIPVVSGAVARMTSVTCMSPLELVRTKLQSGRYTYPEIWGHVRSSVSAEGVSPLWRGWLPSILRDVPFSVFYWSLYEMLKREHVQSWGALPSHASFSYGFLAGMSASVITMPFDVLKTRMQTDLGKAGPRKGLVKVFWVVRRLEGFSGFYVGLVPRMMKVAPACAIMISTYEYFKEYFSRSPLLN